MSLCQKSSLTELMSGHPVGDNHGERGQRACPSVHIRWAVGERREGDGDCETDHQGEGPMQRMAQNSASADSASTCGKRVSRPSEKRTRAAPSALANAHANVLSAAPTSRASGEVGADEFDCQDQRSAPQTQRGLRFPLWRGRSRPLSIGDADEHDAGQNDGAEHSQWDRDGRICGTPPPSVLAEPFQLDEGAQEAKEKGGVQAAQPWTRQGVSGANDKPRPPLPPWKTMTAASAPIRIIEKPLRR